MRIPEFKDVAAMNGWGRKHRVEVHRWGARFGTRWFVWWDLFTSTPCWWTGREAPNAHHPSGNGWPS